MESKGGEQRPVFMARYIFLRRCSDHIHPREVSSDSDVTGLKKMLINR